MASEQRPDWHPPEPFQRERLERFHIDAATFPEVEARQARGEVVNVDTLPRIAAEVEARMRARSHDEFVFDELLAGRERFEEQRVRYDEVTKRPRNLGPLGRAARERAKAEHASALAEAEGAWTTVPGTNAEERTSTIHDRDELAIVKMGNTLQFDAAATVRRLGVEPLEAGGYTLVRYSVRYYAEPVPTVQQVWIEWAMLHASAYDIGRVLWDDRDGRHDRAEVRAQADEEIRRAVHRMLDRGAALPADAKYLDVRLTEMSRFISLVHCT